MQVPEDIFSGLNLIICYFYNGSSPQVNKSFTNCPHFRVSNEGRNINFANELCLTLLKWRCHPLVQLVLPKEEHGLGDTEVLACVLCNSTMSDKDVGAENVKCNKMGKETQPNKTSYFCKALNILEYWNRKESCSVSRYVPRWTSIFLSIYQSFICDPFNRYIIISISLWVSIYYACIYFLCVYFSYLSPYLFIERWLVKGKVWILNFSQLLKQGYFKVECSYFSG